MTSAREQLNALIMEAHARGERPFCCFGCGDWFTETPPFTKPRMVCDDPWCVAERASWLKNGRGRTNPRIAAWVPKRRPVALLFEVAA